ncbi:MAG: HEAT repeat domain-containing protein [Thermoanaerobaculia bacterium]
MTTDQKLLEQARSSDADLRQKAAQQVARQIGPEDLPLIFEMLGDRDWRVRKTIIEGLLREPSARVVEGLLDALHDPENAGKRNSATEALIRIGADALPHVLARVEREGDVDVRLSLVNLLGDLRNEAALERLLKLLATETDVNVLSSVVTSIGKYRDPRSLPDLLRALRRDDLWLKFHVIEALGEIGDRAALPSILPLYAEKSLRKPVLESVGKIADVGTVNFLLKVINEEEKLNLTALRALIRIAEADKPRIVEAAERAVIQKRFREAFPKSKMHPLIDHLRATPKREVRSFILKLLGWSGDAEALDVLLEFIENPETAEVAAEALIDYGSDATIPVLQKLRNSEDDDVTALLLRVLNLIAGAESIPTILSFLDHPNSMIRRLAIETLGEILDPSSIDYLLAELDDADVGAQQAAVNSISALVAAFPEIKNDTLVKIRKLLASSSIPIKLNSLSIYVNIQGEGYHDELLLASKDGDPVIRQKAISLMGKFSEERFAAQLVLSLADESTGVRLAAINAIVHLRPETGLDPLFSSLEDGDVWIRTAAAQALGEYRHQAAVPHLVQHLREDLAPVKIAAIEALGKSALREVLPALLEAADIEDPEIRRAAIQALARIPGEEVFERLTATLQHPDWRLRAAAVVALGNRGDTRVLDQVHHILADDPDPYVQHSAVEAIDKLGRPESFPFLLQSLDNPAILDDVSDLLVRHKEIYRSLLEAAWREADNRREPVIAAILEAMRGADQSQRESRS